MNLPATPLAERPAVDAPTGTPQPEAPPDALFAALLTIQTARTAPAEGQITETRKTPDATTVAELVAALPVAAPLPPQPPAAGAAAPTAEPGKPAPPKATPAVGPTASGGVCPAVPAPHAAPQAPAVDVPAPGVPAPAPAAKAPAKDLPATAQEPPSAQPAMPAVPAHDPKTARPAQQPVQAAKPPVPEAKDAPKDSPKPAAPAPQPEVAAAQPKERPVTTHGTPEPRPVLRGERVEALVRLATRHGTAEARIELHPQELGSVVVKLRMTSDGLQATFTASNPEAVSQLQHAGDDLRRSLEAKGLALATLDVRAEADDAGGSDREQRGWAHSRADRHVEELDGEGLSVTTSIPAGELVDVHA
jgi:flagellar hook-length control protein FliK